MTRYLNPWTRIVLTKLADGQWHNRDDVVPKACRAAMPGRAYRHAVRRRADKGQDMPEGGISRRVRQGQRQTVMAAVRDLVRSGTLEQRGQGRDVYLRLTDLGRSRGVPADPREERADRAG
jgi:hypothetical protein